MEVLIFRVMRRSVLGMGLIFRHLIIIIINSLLTLLAVEN